MAHTRFTHLAGAEDHHRFVSEVGSENLLGKLQRDATDGSSAALSLGFASDRFGRLKGLLEQSIGNRASQFDLMRFFIGAFDLAGDFRLTKYHRIKPAHY